jgi:hypothetical protein
MPAAIFSAFRKQVSTKVQRYLEDLHISVKPHFVEKADWISAKFKWKDITLTFSVSLHHLDYRDGINVYLETKFGTKWLRSEVRKNSSHEAPIYGYGVPEMNAQFDRIIKDMKLHFEKYILV